MYTHTHKIYMFISINQYLGKGKNQLLCLTVVLSLCCTQSLKHPLVSAPFQVIVGYAFGTVPLFPSLFPCNFPIHYGFCLSLYVGFLFTLSPFGPYKLE